MPWLYSSLSGSNRLTSTAYSQPLSRRSLSSFLKWSSLRLRWTDSSASFFISNMMETTSTPSSLSSR